MHREFVKLTDKLRPPPPHLHGDGVVAVDLRDDDDTIGGAVETVPFGMTHRVKELPKHLQNPQKDACERLPLTEQQRTDLSCTGGPEYCLEERHRGKAYLEVQETVEDPKKLDDDLTGSVLASQPFTFGEYKTRSMYGGEGDVERVVTDANADDDDVFQKTIIADAADFAWVLAAEARAVVAMSMIHRCNKSCFKYNDDGSKCCRFNYQHVERRWEREVDQKGKVVKDANGDEKWVKKNFRRNGKKFVPVVCVEPIGPYQDRCVTLRAHPLECSTNHAACTEVKCNIDVQCMDFIGILNDILYAYTDEDVADGRVVGFFRDDVEDAGKATRDALNFCKNYADKHINEAAGCRSLPTVAEVEKYLLQLRGKEDGKPLYGTLVTDAVQKNVSRLAQSRRGVYLNTHLNESHEDESRESEPHENKSEFPDGSKRELCRVQIIQKKKGGWQENKIRVYQLDEEELKQQREMELKACVNPTPWLTYSNAVSW